MISRKKLFRPLYSLTEHNITSVKSAKSIIRGKKKPPFRRTAFQIKESSN
jgi:hypothetical protein